MATLQITLSPATAGPGQTVTATYAISGADDVPASSQTVNVDGTATVDGVELDADVTLTLTRPAVVYDKQYQAPTAPGLTFAPTADPKVWTTVVPA
jgi:hypothetical protein